MTGAPRTPEAYRAVLHGPSGRSSAGSCAVRAHPGSRRLPLHDSRVRSLRCGAGVDEECAGQAKPCQVVARVLAATARSAPTRQCSRRPTWRSHASSGSADGGALPRTAAVGVVAGVGAQNRGDPGMYLVSSPAVPPTVGHAAHAVRVRAQATRSSMHRGGFSRSTRPDRQDRYRACLDCGGHDRSLQRCPATADAVHTGVTPRRTPQTAECSSVDAGPPAGDLSRRTSGSRWAAARRRPGAAAPRRPRTGPAGRRGRRRGHRSGRRGRHRHRRRRPHRRLRTPRRPLEDRAAPRFPLNDRPAPTAAGRLLRGRTCVPSEPSPRPHPSQRASRAPGPSGLMVGRPALARWPRTGYAGMRRGVHLPLGLGPGRPGRGR